MTLYECFENVNDVRNRSGLRHPLPSFLMMVTFSIMSGYTSMQSIATFLQGNKEQFMLEFNLKHGVPGYTQIRTILMELDYASLCNSFQNWASSYVDITKDDWLSIDGKTLRSTVTNYDNEKQNYVAMVSLFLSDLGVVIGTQRYENKKQGENAAAMQLLSNLLSVLQGKGVILTLDALHCQKKQ